MAQILVIDDNEGVRLTMKFILESAGHAAIIVDGGRTALEKLGTHKIDLIITDMLMSEMDGVELMMRIRERCDKLPILAVSGGGNKINMEEALDVAQTLADRVLRKPFTKEEVLDVVTTLLKKTRKNGE